MSNHENLVIGNKETILVVEDNADLNMALCEILESYNYEVRSAANGQEALDSMSGSLPDVILCDIMMPGMDGYTLLRHTRSEPQLRTRPFIFLTALTSTTDQRKAFDIGIEHYLTKPVDEQDLILAIRNALRRQRDMEYEMSRQLDVLRNQIVATLQHEFRTPLTFVLGFAEYLQDIMEQEIDLEGLRTATAGILEGGHRLQRLIESFLMLAELQSREMQPDELEALTAITIIQNVVDDSRVALTKAGLTVDISPDNQDLMVIGEPELLHEAIKRIVDNAIRYRRPASKKIWVSAKPLGETYVGLCVRDEGMGIPPNTVKALSRPFEQGDRSDRTEPGAGLSLALVHHVATLHGGQLEVSSQEGVGSEFTLWLPAAEKLKKK
ncbi:MAG: hybrid sensor histidine kinase/response regulator [Caldilineaceae bacterium]|nr:hybrid sensor histidine kinase/response regulator [Caldilineaceae bacterium]